MCKLTVVDIPNRVTNRVAVLVLFVNKSARENLPVLFFFTSSYLRSFFYWGEGAVGDESSFLAIAVAECPYLALEFINKVKWNKV